MQNNFWDNYIQFLSKLNGNHKYNINKLFAVYKLKSRHPCKHYFMREYNQTLPTYIWMVESLTKFRGHFGGFQNVSQILLEVQGVLPF